MDLLKNNTYDLYKDIQFRTGGEIYLGIVGPVRTGKSTFIKRFMSQLVLPYMNDIHEKERTRDELPQSAGGKTITTTEPKFIPKEAAHIKLAGEFDVKIRLIDCVGFMIDGASGHLENAEERLVKTPWSTEEIPFTKAAEIGTQKVIKDHSTIGIVVTTDGSFGELERRNYVEAEERTVNELHAIGKPFIVLLNSARPFDDETRDLAKQLEEKYRVSVMPVNCEQLKAEDIDHIMEKVLYEFPLTMIEFYMPKWVDLLPKSSPVKSEIIQTLKDYMKQVTYARDLFISQNEIKNEYIKNVKLEQINLANGCVNIRLETDDIYYYQMLSDMIGEPIHNEYQLITLMKEMSSMKKEYVKVLHALDSVRYRGYGVIMPERNEIKLDKPELTKQGNKYGVKIKAESPSIHMINARIETEIAPIVGTEEQAKDLISYIGTNDSSNQGIWETNIFGKTVEQLVFDGISNKISMIDEECQIKLQESMQKIVNDSTGGIVCIII